MISDCYVTYCNHSLDHESGSQPIRSTGGVAARGAAGAHTTEVIRGVVTRGSLPPKRSSASRRMSLLDLAVAGRLIGVLCLVVLLVLVGESSRPENLILSKQR